jgi:hypothetical protein
MEKQQSPPNLHSDPCIEERHHHHHLYKICRRYQTSIVITNDTCTIDLARYSYAFHYINADASTFSVILPLPTIHCQHPRHEHHQ